MRDKTRATKIDRDEIGRAALALADERGLEAITARALAERLGVTPMALYRHVPSIPSVAHELLERVVRAAPILDHDEDALEAWLVTTFERIHATLLDHPAVIALAGTPAGYGPASLAVLDVTVGRLTSAGRSRGEAVAIFHALFSFTLGSASLMAAARRARAWEGAELALALSERDLPHLRGAAKELARFGDPSTFERGLAELVAARLGSDPPRAPRPGALRRRGPRPRRAR